MNPAAQIPAIDDAGFKLGESMAILGAFSNGECLPAPVRILTKAASKVTKQTLQHIWQRRAAGRICGRHTRRNGHG